MKTRIAHTIVFLLFLYWATSPNIKGAANALLFLLFILSAAFWQEMKNASLRHWALLLALPFLFTLFQKLFIFPDLKPNVFDAPSRFLLASACIFAFYQTPAQQLARALFGVLFGAIGLGVWAYVSTHFEAFFWLKGERAWNGFSNPIPFGLLATIFAMMAINLPHAFFSIIPKKLFWALKIIAFAAGLYAAYASLSRTALLVLPFLAMILIFQNFQQSKKIAASIVVFGGVLIGGLLSIDNPYQDRVLYGFKEIQNFEKNPYTSMGQRFLLWQDALKTIQKEPVWGLGKGGFVEKMIQRQKMGLPLPGLLMLLALYFVPLVFCLKRLKNNNQIIRFAATNGAIITSSFALAGTLDTFFWITNQTTFYALSVALFVAMILQVENQQKQKITT